MTTYLSPAQTAGRDFLMRNIEGPVIMLNLLRFQTMADYRESPHLAPPSPISGEEAYHLYIKHTIPFLEKSGGEIVFMGKARHFLIGPPEERWDAVLLIRQKSVDSFMAFASDAAYLKGMGHRTAALEDSRLLPMTEENI